jgi:hypothetical protein
VRRVAVDQAHQFQLLGVGGRGEDGQGVLHQVAQVERDAVEHQLAGLDLREVEDLVDDPQQVVGGLLDGAQVVELARGQLAFCSRWVKPRMPLSGVRISWLMLARNST